MAEKRGLRRRLRCHLHRSAAGAALRHDSGVAVHSFLLSISTRETPGPRSPGARPNRKAPRALKHHTSKQMLDFGMPDRKGWDPQPFPATINYDCVRYHLLGAFGAKNQPKCDDRHTLGPRKRLHYFERPTPDSGLGHASATKMGAKAAIEEIRASALRTGFRMADVTRDRTQDRVGGDLEGRRATGRSIE